MTISKPDEELSGEEWCAQNGVNPGGGSSVVVPHTSEEAWLSSMPAAVATEIKSQLDDVSSEYREGLDLLFQQHEEKPGDVERRDEAGDDAVSIAWNEDDLDELCPITEDDIQLATDAATPKLRELTTVPSTRP